MKLCESHQCVESAFDVYEKNVLLLFLSEFLVKIPGEAVDMISPHPSSYETFLPVSYEV